MIPIRVLITLELAEVPFHTVVLDLSHIHAAIAVLTADAVTREAWWDAVAAALLGETEPLRDLDVGMGPPPSAPDTYNTLVRDRLALIVRLLTIRAGLPT